MVKTIPRGEHLEQGQNNDVMGSFEVFTLKNTKG